MNNPINLSTVSISEFRNNPRLRWMTLAALVLVFFSTISWLSSLVTAMRSDTLAAVNFASRLQDISDKPFDADALTKIKKEVNQQIALFPEARSGSVAEAQALKELEETLGSLIARKRVNLLGSERLQTDTTFFWQVRLEITGQLQSSKLIDLLSYFDSTQAHRRINAFRYQLHRSNTINIVVDLLYRGTEDE